MHPPNSRHIGPRLAVEAAGDDRPRPCEKPRSWMRFRNARRVIGVASRQAGRQVRRAYPDVMGYEVVITLTNQTRFDLHLAGLEYDGDGWQQEPVATVKAGSVTQLLWAHGGTAPFGPGCSGVVTYRWKDDAALVRRIDIDFSNPVVGSPSFNATIDGGVFIDTTATVKQVGSQLFVTVSKVAPAVQPASSAPGSQTPVIHVPYAVDGGSQVAAVSWGPDRIDVFCASVAIPAPGWPLLIHG